ncbi:RHS repeat domain-containing protein [Arthrobacter sp. KN11-1C]|uniref:RHS repeat domain-containing protein n=1 Tax=Arthrobacter sp. KN11-1C TaxID=3445774 RepID=UPI003F9F96EB
MVLPPASGTNGIASGNRGAAAMVTRHLTDMTAMSWNPTNGNVVLTGQLLHVKGAGRDLGIGWRYNSLNDTRPTLSVGGTEAAVTVGGDNSVVYTAPDGGTYTFAPAGTGAWAMPPGLNATITTFTSTAVTIRFNDTGYSNEYTKVGSVFQLTSQDDQNATAPNKITFTYNTAGLLTTINDTIGGRPVTFSYNDPNNAGQPSQIHDDALSRDIYLEYSGPNGAMSKVTDATGAVMSFGYGGSNNQITTITDDAGTVTTLAYDASTRLSQATYATGKPIQSVWQYTYASYPVDGFFAYVKDPNLKTTYFRSITQNQVVQTQDPLGDQAQFTVDGHDNVTSTQATLGNTTTYTFNANNSLTKVTNPAGGTAGAETTFAYPSNTGNPLSNYQPTSSVSSENQTTSYSYDANTNNRYQTTTPGAGGGAGGTPKLNYQGDAAGTTCGAKKGQVCKSTDGNGNVTTYAYGALGMPTTVTPPSPLGAVTNVYDAASRLTKSTDGKGQVTLYDYDDNDRLIQIDKGVNCASNCVSYTYDTRGNLTQSQDDTGNTNFTWDAQNRPTSKSFSGTTTSVTYDGASNVVSFTDPTGTVNYAYDAANRLLTLAEPGGSCPATPAFPNSTKCTGFSYDNNNRRTATKYPNGVTNTTVYDGASRVTSITATNSSNAVLAKRAYTFTVNGTKDGALRKTVTTETGAVTTYGYDEINRLTSAVTGSTTETWTYDKDGNRTVDTKTGTANVYSAYNGADQLCWSGASAGSCATPPGGATSYSYDANGNTTASGSTTQTYNIFDQFTSNTSGSTATNYTYNGPRNDSRLTAGATAFLNGSLGITQQTTAGATTSFIRDPSGNLISMRTSTGASFYYTMDGLGSTILLTDSAQAAAATYSYDSWGNTTSSGAQAATNPWTYAGGYNDTTNNRIKFGARYYNPFRGRFTQVDPSGQESNRYAYVGCNPINAKDPTGLDFGSCLRDSIISATLWGIGTEAAIGAVGGFILGLETGPGAVATAAGGAVIGAVGGALTGAWSGLWQGSIVCGIAALLGQ